MGKSVIIIKKRKTKSCSDINPEDSCRVLFRHTPIARKPQTGTKQVAKLWRNMMQLQLPMDISEWYDDGRTIELSSKPAMLTANNDILVYNVTAAKSEAAMPSATLQARPNGRSILKPNRGKSQQILPTVIITDAETEAVKVFDPNPNIKKSKSRVSSRGGTSTVSVKITNRELLAHTSPWRRLLRLCCCKTEVNPLDVGGSTHEPRTLNSLTYITTHLELLMAKRVPQGRAEARATLIDAYKKTIDALRHLAKVKELCDDAVGTLTYSKVYLDRELTEEELRLTDKKSIVGSFIWLSTYCIQYLAGKDVDEAIKFDIKLRTEDVVGSSVLLWSAMVHVVETIRSCLNIFEHSIMKYVFTLRAPEEERRDSEEHHEVNPDKLDRIRRRRWKIKHTAEIKAANEDMYYWQGKSNIPRPQLKVFVRNKNIMGSPWLDLKDQNNAEILSVIVKSSTKLLTIVEDELTQLTNLDKAVQSIVPALDTIKRPKNLLESTLLLERVMHSLHEFPNNLLKQAEVDEVKEIGRIVLDRIDELTNTLEILLASALEARHIIHICYEYTRTYYKWPLAEYDTFAAENHKKYMGYWAHNDEFQVAKPPESIREPIPFFHDSGYKQIMRTVILNAADRDVCVGPIDSVEPVFLTDPPSRPPSSSSLAKTPSLHQSVVPKNPPIVVAPKESNQAPAISVDEPQKLPLKKE